MLSSSKQGLITEIDRVGLRKTMEFSRDKEY